MIELPALSLWQPWATFMELGLKTIETRSWAAPPALIGQRFGIQATKKPMRRVDVPLLDLAEGYGDVEFFYDHQWYVRREENGRLWIKPLPFGKLIASATLVACLPVESIVFRESPRDYDRHWIRVTPERDVEPKIAEVIPAEEPFGDYSSGRYAWLFDDVRSTYDRCPACWRLADCLRCGGSGSIPVPGGGTACPDCFQPSVRECEFCEDYGNPDPIAAKGGQRIWYWRPDAA